MALYDTTWYANAGDQSTTGYYAVTKRPQNTAVAAGVLRRQFTAPAVGNERVFVCIVAGTTANVTDATWVLTRGAKTTDGTATWMECTGQAALNGDLTNTATWAQVKAVTPAVLGQVIKRSNNASYQICTTAGAMSASEPGFSDTAGVTTTDTTAVWTSLGPVGSFTGGQAPHARLVNACAATWFAAGNTVYVGDNHAESQAAALTLTPALSIATIGKIICHNYSGSYPPTAPATGATIALTATGNITLNPATGGLYVYGLTFKTGVGLSTTASLLQLMSGNGGWGNFDNCSFQLASSGANSIVLGATSGATNSIIFWNNCTISFGNVADTISVAAIANFSWQNTGTVLAGGSLVPTSLISPQANSFSNTMTFEALDLSQLTGNIWNPTAFSEFGSLTIKDCKLNASGAIVSPAAAGQTVQLVRTDSGATAYKSARYQYEGTETTEISITRVGGAADPTGQAQSRKIVTTANSQWLRPFKAEPYAVWNPATGSTVTVTVCGTINAGTLPNNDDVWIEVEYLGSSATPVGTIVTSTKANVLASNAAVSSDSSTWNGGGSGAGWSPFKLVATLSSPQPAMAGYIHVRVRAAKLSTTYYIDPQIVLT